MKTRFRCPKCQNQITLHITPSEAPVCTRHAPRPTPMVEERSASDDGGVVRLNDGDSPPTAPQ
jgi:hypothetical protein